MNTSALRSLFAVLLAVLFGGHQSADAALAPAHTLGGAVTGLATGNSVVLRNLNGSEVRVTRNGSFTFGNFSEGASYEVTVKTHPSFPAGNCIVTGGTGTIADVDVTVDVTCTLFPQITSLQAVVDAIRARTVFSFMQRPVSMPAGTEFNLYVSTRPDCDFSRDTFTGCPGEKSRSGPDVGLNLISQFAGQSLKNGQDYFLRMETVFANGAKGLSNLARARPNEVAFNNTVRAITVAPDGTVYLGGSFTSAGVATGSAVPFELSTGFPTTKSFPAIAGTVRAIVDDGAGGWYLGGQFTQVGSLPHRNLTHVLADGGVDLFWKSFPNGPVHALERVGRVIYVGGSFSSINRGGSLPDVPRRNAAAVMDTSHGQGVNAWDPSPNDTVRALKGLGDVLYMGGDFTAGNGKPGFFAAFETSDDLPLSNQPLPFDMNLDGPVRALATNVVAHSLYIGGSFKTFGNARRVNLAKILQSGRQHLLSGFQPNPGVADSISSVNTLAVADNDSTIYIGGSFATIVGQGAVVSRTNFAAVSESGALLNWKPNPNSAVESIATAGGQVYLGGSFSAIDDFSGRVLVHNFAKIGALDGEVDWFFHAQPGATVRALALSGDVLYAGGDFNFLDAKKCGFLAALSADGSFPGWNPDADGPINALVYHNNRFHGPVLYAGGTFTSFGRSSGHADSRRYLVALNPSLNTTQYLPDSRNFIGGASGPVNALAVLESSDALYVGGTFSIVANSLVQSLAKLFLFNGTVNRDFKPQPTGVINALIATTDAVSGRDVVYAGGFFGDIRKNDSTPSRVNLAKLDANSGTALDEFVVNTNGTVSTLALSRDPHAIYVGGVFDRINGTLIGTPGAGGLAAVEIDGSPLLTGCSTCFNPGPDGGNPQALATFPLGFGERVFAGGSFPNIGGGPISNFAALTGYSYGAPTGFSSGSFVFPNGTVSALAVVGNKVYIGGAFSGFHGSVNGSSSGGVRGNFGVVDATTGELIN